MAIGHPCKTNAMHMPRRLAINGSELNPVLKKKLLRAIRGWIQDGSTWSQDPVKAIKFGLSALSKLGFCNNTVGFACSTSLVCCNQLILYKIRLCT